MAATVRWESLAYLDALGNHNFIFSMILDKSLLSTGLKTKTTLWSKVGSRWRQDSSEITLSPPLILIFQMDLFQVIQPY